MFRLLLFFHWSFRMSVRRYVRRSSVGPSVDPSVGPSVGHTFEFPFYQSLWLHNKIHGAPYI